MRTTVGKINSLQSVYFLVESKRIDLILQSEALGV